MKIRPYRQCDICHRPYHKDAGDPFQKKQAIKAKIRYPGDFEIPGHWSKMDICPECAQLMLEWIREIWEDLEGDSNV